MFREQNKYRFTDLQSITVLPRPNGEYFKKIYYPEYYDVNCIHNDIKINEFQRKNMEYY